MPSRRQVLTTIGALTVAGCAAGPQSENQPTQESQVTATTTDNPHSSTVEVMTDLSSENWQQEWEQKIVPGFESQSDLTVNVRYPPRYPSELRDRANRGDFPEVFHGTSLEVANYIVEGQTQAVDGFVSSLTDANGPLISDHSIRGPEATHLVPHGLSMMVFNYRSDIYNQLGLSVPTTWSELLENTQAIAESDQVDAAGFAVPTTDISTKPREDFLTWLYSAGGHLWRWTNESETAVEPAFEMEPVQAALEQMRNLRTYSPDAQYLGYTGTISEWLSGNVAQCLFPNASLAGYCYDQQHPNAVSIATNTRQAAVPLRDSTLSPPTRGRTWVTGTPLFQGINTSGAEEFLTYLYGGPAAQAARNGVNTQYLPPYEGIIELDAYQNSRIYQVEDGHFWELEQTLLNEVSPEYRGSRPRTPAAWYAMQGPSLGDDPSVLNQMVRAIVVDENQIREEISRAQDRLQSRLEEGQRRSK